MEILALFWIAGGIVFGGFCSFVAGQKNRDRFAWFVWGFFFQVVALLALIGVPSLPEPSAGEDGARVCPFCGEAISPDAAKCPRCA